MQSILYFMMNKIPIIIFLITYLLIYFLGIWGLFWRFALWHTIARFWKLPGTLSRSSFAWWRTWLHRRGTTACKKVMLVLVYVYQFQTTKFIHIWRKVENNIIVNCCIRRMYVELKIRLRTTIYFFLIFCSFIFWTSKAWVHEISK